MNRRGWLVTVGAVLVIVMTAWLVPSRNLTTAAGDLRTYFGAVQSMMNGSGLYEFSLANPGLSPMTFLYPPFAALLMIPLQFAPVGSVVTGWQLLQLAVLGVLVGLLVRAGGERTAGKQRGLLLPVLLWVASVLSLPVVFNLYLGQVSLFIVALVLIDLLMLPPKWRGTLVGLAGAIKLTPMIFVPYFLITRQWRAAANSAAGFVGAAAIGLIFLPRESIQYWTSIALDSSRIPDIGSPRNLTVFGILKYWGVQDVLQRPIWLLIVATIGVLAFWRARRLYDTGDQVSAVLALGTASVVMGPIAWDHHMVWLVLVGVWMVLTGTKRGVVLGWVLLGVLMAFSPIWPHVEHPVLWMRALGMTPVLLSIWIGVAGQPFRSVAPASGPEPEVLEVV